MKTTARINLRGEIVPHYSDWSAEQYRDMNRKIIDKMKCKTVELPCRPNRGDCINLKTFRKEFALTKLENECLEDGNYMVKVIDIEVCNGYLNVHVEKIE